MELGTIIFGGIAVASILFLLILIGRGELSLPPLYGPPEKNGGTKVEPSKRQKPSR